MAKQRALALFKDDLGHANGRCARSERIHTMTMILRDLTVFNSKMHKHG
jgi:hypothetical protein